MATKTFSSLQTSDRIGVKINPERLKLAPGESAAVRIFNENKGGVVDEFELRVEGLDSRWYTVVDGSDNLFPGEEGHMEVEIHLPLDHTVEAGLRFVLFRVVSRLNPREATAVELPFEIAHYGKVDIQIAPKAVTTSRVGQYRVLLANNGNAEQVVDLSIVDDEQALKYSIELDRVAVRPGESDEVRFKVWPRKTLLFSDPVKFEFNLVSYPAGDELAEPSLARGTLEVLPPLRFLTVFYPYVRRFLRPAFMLVIAGAILSWVFGAPGARAPEVPPRPTRPPVIIPTPVPDEEELAARAAIATNEARATEVAEGGAAAASGPGGAAGAAGTAGGASRAAGGAAGAAGGGAGAGAGAGGTAGAAGPGGAAAAAGAVGPDGQPAAAAAAGPATSAPAIMRFDVTLPTEGPPGMIELNWEVQGAKTVTIGGEEKAPSGVQPLAIAEVEGTQIELVATNELGTTSHTIGIVMFRPPEVFAFTVEPNTVQPGTPVKLTWEAARAANAAVYGPGLDASGAVVDKAKGTLEVTPNKTGAYKLVLQNDLGRAEREAYVVVGRAAGTPAAVATKPATTTAPTAAPQPAAASTPQPASAARP